LWRKSDFKGGLSGMNEQGGGFLQIILHAVSLPFRQAGRFLLAAAPWIGFSIWLSVQFTQATPQVSTVPGRGPTIPLTWPLGLTMSATFLTFFAFAAVWLRIGYFSPDVAGNGPWRHFGRNVLRLIWLSIKLFLVVLAVGLIFALVTWIFGSIELPFGAVATLDSVILGLYAFVLIWLGCRLSVAAASVVVDNEPRGLLDSLVYTKGHLLVILCVCIILSVLTAAIKFGFWASVYDVNVTLFLVLLISPFQSQALQLGTTAPLWFILVDTVIGCIGLAWVIGAIARLYRLIAPPATDSRVAEVF
jgi:hypothetical protein